MALTSLPPTVTEHLTHSASSLIAAAEEWELEATRLDRRAADLRRVAFDNRTAAAKYRAAAATLDSGTEQ